MIKLLARFVIWIGRWDVQNDFKDMVPEKCIMIAVPHTSNWDFPYARAVFYEMGIPLKFTIKKQWVRFPWGGLFRAMGAIAIDRRPKENTGRKLSYTEAMIDMINDYEGQLCIIITPEGTRTKQTEWKTGFYYAAKGAGVPIVLGFLDYTTRKAGAGKLVYPSDDIEADMREIMDFYKDIKGKNPEDFSIDMRYEPDVVNA